MSMKNGSEPVVWLCRPLADSERMANILHNQNIPSVINPVMDITPISNATTQTEIRADIVILTSQHALHATKLLPRETSLFVVGETLGDRLKSVGFTSVNVYPSAQNLLDATQQQCRTNQMIHYLRGKVVRLDIVEMLSKQGYAASETICYETKPLHTLDVRLKEALKHRAHCVILPLHAIQASTYAAALLKEHQLGHAMQAIRVCCISDVVAKAAKQSGFSQIEVSPQSNHLAMQALVIQTFHAKLAQINA